jgi:hypothetical protein
MVKDGLLAIVDLDRVLEKGTGGERSPSVH